MRSPHLTQRRRLLQAMELVTKGRLNQSRSINCGHSLTGHQQMPGEDCPMSRVVFAYDKVHRIEYKGKLMCRSSIDVE